MEPRPLKPTSTGPETKSWEEGLCQQIQEDIRTQLARLREQLTESKGPTAPGRAIPGLTPETDFERFRKLIKGDPAGAVYEQGQPGAIQVSPFDVFKPLRTLIDETRRGLEQQLGRAEERLRAHEEALKDQLQQIQQLRALGQAADDRDARLLNETRQGLEQQLGRAEERLRAHEAALNEQLLQFRSLEQAAHERDARLAKSEERLTNVEGAAAESEKQVVFSRTASEQREADWERRLRRNHDETQEATAELASLKRAWASLQQTQERIESQISESALRKAFGREVEAVVDERLAQMEGMLRGLNTMMQSAAKVWRSWPAGQIEGESRSVASSVPTALLWLTLGIAAGYVALRFAFPLNPVSGHPRGSAANSHRPQEAAPAVPGRTEMQTQPPPAPKRVSTPGFPGHDGLHQGD